MKLIKLTCPRCGSQMEASTDLQTVFCTCCGNKMLVKNKIDLTTAQDYVGKSSNNYLKMLKVEGYELTPEFNRQNDSYTIYVKDDSINNFNVIAETDNEKARVEGIGNINISSNDRKINVKVTAENGNINMYTINVENESNKPKDPKQR